MPRTAAKNHYEKAGASTFTVNLRLAFEEV
jgi:hypothetical protein